MGVLNKHTRALLKTPIEPERNNMLSEQSSLSVEVKTMTGRVIALKIEKEDTVEHLKQKITQIEGIPIDEQKITLGGITLEDSKLLKNIGGSLRLSLFILKKKKQQEKKSSDEPKVGLPQSPQKNRSSVHSRNSFVKSKEEKQSPTTAPVNNKRKAEEDLSTDDSPNAKQTNSIIPKRKKKTLKKAQKNLSKCWTCKKKVGLLGFKCHCGFVFCGVHRYPEKHLCMFDYKTNARINLVKQNPKVSATKITHL